MTPPIYTPAETDRRPIAARQWAMSHHLTNALVRAGVSPNAISVAGAHFRDAGANAVQEMAFTLMDGVTYCDEVMARGRMTIDEFAPQVSFFFYTHGDFFEEIAKYRAGRRRWATIVRERYGATTDKASMFRFGCVAGGAS